LFAAAACFLLLLLLQCRDAGWQSKAAAEAAMLLKEQVRGKHISCESPTPTYKKLLLQQSCITLQQLRQGITVSQQMRNNGMGQL
jgi:hypothetical protein